MLRVLENVRVSENVRVLENVRTSENVRVSEMLEYQNKEVNISTLGEIFGL